jgi:hypothetical protein
MSLFRRFMSWFRKPDQSADMRAKCYRREHCAQAHQQCQPGCPDFFEQQPTPKPTPTPPSDPPTLRSFRVPAQMYRTCSHRQDCLVLCREDCPLYSPVPGDPS